MNVQDKVLQEIIARHTASEMSGKLIPVSEIFGPTIEGEGAVIGTQTFFIRFAGCDYKCKRCDSLHAVLPELFKETAKTVSPTVLADIMFEYMRKKNVSIPFITLTGGNPCLWDLKPFIARMRELVDDAYDEPINYLVETQGTFWQDWLYECDHVTVSPKGPGFGEKFEEARFMNFITKLHLFKVDNHYPDYNIKVVIFDQRDIEFAKHIVELVDDMCDVYLSIGNHNTPQAIAEWEEQTGNKFDRMIMPQRLLHHYRTVLEDVYQEPDLRYCRILPQMHALLWGNDKGR